MDFTKIEGFLKKGKRSKIHACYLGIIPIKTAKGMKELLQGGL